MHICLCFYYFLGSFTCLPLIANQPVRIMKTCSILLAITFFFMPFLPANAQQTYLTLDSATIEGAPMYYNSMGDTWVNTWDKNDNLLIAWGDGTGLTDGFPSADPANDNCRTLTGTLFPWQDKFCILNWTDCAAQQYCPTVITDAGLGVALGPVSGFTQISNLATNIPGDTPWVDATWQEISRNDKPTSLLAYNDTLFAHLHTKRDTIDVPFTYSDTGYVAYTVDMGTTWTSLINTTPWYKGAPGNLEKFTVMMWINMGQNFADNQDGYLYGLGIGKEIFWTELSVYLARVPAGSIANYDAYEYLTGYNTDGSPVFKKLADFAAGDQPAAVNGLTTIYKGSAIYHKYSDSYLFMTSDLEGELYLFQAPKPWGPWRYVSTLIELDGVPYGGGPGTVPIKIPPGWDVDGYVPALIAKDAGPDSVYFTISNVGKDPYYQLIIGKLKLHFPTVTGLSPQPQMSEKVFAVYPVPAVGVINISYRTHANRQTQLQVFDAQGRLLQQMTLPGGNFQRQLNLSLTNGIYQLRLLDGRQIAGSQKLIIN